MTRCKALPDFQLLRANLSHQGANELLNSMYQMVQQQNSQAFAERLTWIKESLHNLIPKSNIVLDANSHKTAEPTKDLEEVKKYPSP